MGLGDEHLEALQNVPWEQTSRVIGWTYVFLWTISFYPQPWLNFKRKATVGLSIDYFTANLYGALCFIVNAAVLLYSPIIRNQYAQRHPSAPHPSTRLNDLAFAVHAAVAICVVLSQFKPELWGFQVPKSSRLPSRSMFMTCFAFTLCIAMAAIRIAITPSKGFDVDSWCWLDLINLLGEIKVLISIIKYFPQAWLNYQRKSTVGFNIYGVLLDLVGGFLSLAQLGIDCTLDGDWKQVTSNPLKFGLGNISIIFSAIFIWQHYVQYRNAPDELAEVVDDAGAEDASEETPLLRP